MKDHSNIEKIELDETVQQEAILAAKAEAARRIAQLEAMEAAKQKQLDRMQKRMKRGLSPQSPQPIVRDRNEERRALAQLALDDIRAKITCKAWEVHPRPKTSSEYRQLLRWLEANDLIARDPFNPGVIHATIPRKRITVPNNALDQAMAE